MRRGLAVVAALCAWAPPAPGAPPVAEPSAVAYVGLVDALPPAPSLEERLAEIRRRIQAALRYPDLSRGRGEAGQVLVRFEIGEGGRPRGIETARSSGRWLLDRAAERAVSDAAPLPYVWGRLEVPVHFALER